MMLSLVPHLQMMNIGRFGMNKEHKSWEERELEYRNAQEDLRKLVGIIFLIMMIVYAIMVIFGVIL
jgi:hypothetical protein